MLLVLPFNHEQMAFAESSHPLLPSVPLLRQSLPLRPRLSTFRRSVHVFPFAVGACNGWARGFAKEAEYLLKGLGDNGGPCFFASLPDSAAAPCLLP